MLQGISLKEIWYKYHAKEGYNVCNQSAELNFLTIFLQVSFLIIKPDTGKMKGSLHLIAERCLAVMELSATIIF